jgi:hypothetical protein
MTRSPWPVLAAARIDEGFIIVEGVAKASVVLWTRRAVKHTTHPDTRIMGTGIIMSLSSGGSRRMFGIWSTELFHR